MRGTMTGKILSEHLVSGRLEAGQEIGLRIDQTLLQDATGTMACMEFEALGLDRVRVDLALQYVDHNMLGFDHRNADDHLFLQGCAARYGLHYSRAGNGICHQVHTERFARPGATLLGADSHTPTSGACGSIAIGAGGLEVALAMAGYPFETPTPIVVGVHLEGELPPWVASKDLILWLIREYTRQGRPQPHLRVHRPGRGRPAGDPAGHRLQHDHRARRDHRHLPLRRPDPPVPGPPAARGPVGRARAGRRRRLRRGGPRRPGHPGAADRQAPPARQRGAGRRGGRHPGVPGLLRLQRQLLVRGPGHPGGHAVRPAPAADHGRHGVAGQPPDPHHHHHLGRAGGPGAGRPAHPGAGLRAVRRHRPGPADRQGQRPHLQPQLQGPFGHRRRPGLPGLPGDHGGHRAAR